MTRSLVLAVAVALAASGAASAQGPSPYKPAPAMPLQPGQVGPAAPRQAVPPKLPWERDVERYFSRQAQDPGMTGLRKMYEDPLAKYGLPANPAPSSLAPRQGAPPPATLPPEVDRLDANRDGTITRQEYLSGRTRTPPVLGGTPSLREQALNARNNTRFRHTDRNGDGIVTPGELGSAPNSRF